MNPSMGAPAAPFMARTVLKMDNPTQPCTAGAFAVCASIAVAKNRKHFTARFGERDNLTEVVP